MSELIILESSCNFTNKINNASWETVYNPNYVINDGDMIMLKNAFINDTALSGSNINIDADIELKFEFGFYIINGMQFINYQLEDDVFDVQLIQYMTPTYATPPPNPIPNPRPAYGPGIPTLPNVFNSGFANVPVIPVLTDFQPYVFHTYSNALNQYELFTESHSIILKKGSYTPQQIQSFITNKLSSVNNKNFQGDTNRFGQFDATQLNSGSKFLVNVTTGSTMTDDGYFLRSYTNTTDMDTVYKFKLVAPADNDANLIQKITYFMGTSQLALDYNPENETFQFSFMHTPLTDTNGNISIILTRMAYHIQEGAVTPLMTQTKQGGIFFTKLEPVEFWENLGFNLNNVLVDVSNGVNTDEILRKTTDQQLGMSTILSFFSPSFPKQNPCINQGVEYVDTDLVSTNACNPYYIASQNIIPIEAENTYQSSNSGYYFVRANFGLNSTYSDGQKTYGSMSGVVSKQFSANDYITGFSDSGIPYVHKGASALLSNIKIEILDSKKNLASNLKPNSSVFFQIIRNQQPSQVMSPKNPAVK